MLKTFKAIIDQSGQIKSLEEDVQFDQPQEVLITILDEDQLNEIESALLSEKALAKDWNKDEEEQAWQHLQKEK